MLASVTLHAAVLLSQQSTDKISETPLSTMQITLGSIQAVAAPVAATQKKAAPPTPKQTKKIAAAPKVVEAPPVASVSEEPVSPPQQSAPTTSTENRDMAAMAEQAARAEQQRITLTQLLRQALHEHFYYPMLARKRGWQGEVQLAFSLDTSGTIINARIAQGSGYSALDRAALKSLSKVATIEVGLSQAHSFKLPVIYSLNGG